MKNYFSLKQLFLLFIISSYLVACGGGGGGAPPNRAPIVSGPVLVSANENDPDFTISSNQLLAMATDADGDTLSISGLILQSGDDSAITINGNSIDVTPDSYNSFSATDSEVISLSFTISDSQGGSASGSLLLTITGTDDPPTRIALNNISLSNETPSTGGVVVGNLFADDAEGGAIVFSVTGGQDAEHFSVNNNQLLIDDGVLDFTTQSQYSVSLSATDSTSQTLVTEFTVLVIEPQPLNIGYYDVVLNTGKPEQATPIVFIGDSAINVGNLDDADLSGLDILFAQNPATAVPSGPFASELNQSKIAEFVSGGGVLIFHDRYVDNIEDFLPGKPGELVFNIGATRIEFETLNDNTFIAQGPAGLINDSNLESNNSLSFGYLDATTTPIGAIGYLSRNDPDHWITYAYPVDRGWVVYSAIPLDFYLLNGNPDIMRDVYAPNVLAQGRAILKKGADADNDDLLDVEEEVLGTASDNSDSDNDGLLDSFEVRYGLDPLTSGDDVVDLDGDGLSNLEEQVQGTLIRVADTDGDGLNDGDEINLYSTDPLQRDSDGDDLSDFDEVNIYMTDPNLSDTDGGGSNDGREVFLDETDPLDASDDLGQIALPLTISDGNGFNWDIQQDGNIQNGSVDAYDGGMLLSLDGSAFSQFDMATSLQNGREMVIGLDNISGLQVNRRIYIPENLAFARYMEILVNPTDTDITTQLTIDTNLGSDGSTVIVSTSDSDASFEATDTWIVSDDLSDGGGDPSLAHVIAGNNVNIPPSAVSSPTGLLSYTYDVVVPANGRAIIMHFASQNSNRSAALSSAGFLVGLGSGTLNGISSQEIQDIVNFNVNTALQSSSSALLTFSTDND